MTDTRALPPEVLAAIAKRAEADLAPPDWARQKVALKDCRALLAHIEYLNGELAEAERDATASADVVGQLVEGTDHWSTMAADLTAQIERERANHAATVKAQDEYAIGLQVIVATANRERDFAVDRVERFAQLCEDLATEKAARLAAEGREAELRNALERYGKHDGQMPDRRPCLLLTDENGRPQSDHCTCGLADALASPDRGASAVLAAVDRWADGGSRTKDDLELLKVVDTWRARRSGGDGGVEFYAGLAFTVTESTTMNRSGVRVANDG